MSTSFSYYAPEHLDELFGLLDTYGNKAVVMAGGTDVVVDIRTKRIMPDAVIQLKNIAELNSEIDLQQGEIKIGALATLSEITANKSINTYFPALVQAAGSVGSKQIRNRGTLAGNICNASPAADTASPLLLYDAKVCIAGKDSKKSVPIGEFFVGPRKSVLAQGEIVEGIVIPVPKVLYGSCYLRLSRRKGVDLSMLGVSAMATEAGELRISLGAVGPKPIRAYQTEKILFGLADEKKLDEAMALLQSETSPISDLRASKEYRQAMIAAYAKRTIKGALSDLAVKRQKE